MTNQVTGSPAVDASPEAAHAATVARDPWQRFGWIMGVIWLVFLGFPLAAALTVDRHPASRAAAVLLIVLFAAVYTHGFVRLGRAEGCGAFRWGPGYVSVLVVLVGQVAAAVGPPALGMVCFVVALGMFVLPLPASLGVFALGLTSTASVAWLVDGYSDQWYVVGIVGLVGTATFVTRMLDEQGARHRELAGELALAADRDRVARDVHDVLGHSLTVVTVKAELAERLVDTDPGRAKAELTEIRTLSRQALAEIRATVGGLRVARLAEEIQAARAALLGAGIEPDLPADPSQVDPRHRIVLAWVLREAVTNVVRHSGARRCRVLLGADWLSVEDDGHGLRGTRREGQGLRGIRERVEPVGGSVMLGSGLDAAGTGIRVQL